MPTGGSLQAAIVQDLYLVHQGWLQGWLRKKLGCAFEAADLMHDTFIRVLSGQDAARIREPRAYLTTVAHGLMVNHLRRKELEHAYLQALARQPEPEVHGPETRALVLETLMEIDALLDGLPPKVRRAFLLSQLEGRSHAEIAEDLGVSVSSVRQYLTRAVRQCLSLLL